jgi:flagellar hook-associated protein 3 FlgL
MPRVATIPFQRTMSSSMQQAQQALTATQAQLATGKKSTDYAGLGSAAVRNISSHSLRARQEAYAAASTVAGTTLSFNDAHMTALDSGAMSLKQDLLTAIGTGKTTGLSDAINAAFQTFRASLNASEGGGALFGGSQTDGPPFLVNKVADTLTTPASAAFANDGVKASARLADGLDVEFGVTASEIGSGLYTAFQTLASAGTLGTTPTAAQLAILGQAAGEIDDGLAMLRGVSAENGRKQAQAEVLGTRASDRASLLQGVISGYEDADLGQIATDLAQQKTVLQASYSVFSQLSGLSLVNFLR